MAVIEPTTGQILLHKHPAAATPQLNNLASVAINIDLVGAVSGGMGIRGGTVANDDLILEGTTNATRTTSYVSLQPNGGFVSIGNTAPVSKLHVLESGTNYTTQSSDPAGTVNVIAPDVAGVAGNLTVYTNNGYAADTGGSIALGGFYHADNNAAIYAVIKAGKLNGTSGQYGGYLTFATREQAVGLVERMRISSTGSIILPSTITAVGTTGNQTINKPAGRVNIAASGTTVTVTNSLVSANSIVLVVVATADATATVKSVVPGAGSFVITSAAVTAETAFSFLVIS